ncbi:MAG: hypothetical protein H0U74_16040 [Bradymonadaceae bacterium]|nr:hypothetical protein [Lujinxingiaceae bacterium]
MIAATLALTAQACSGAQSSRSADDSGSAQPAKAASDPQACSGQLVPPTGYHQETAFEVLSTSNAREVALERARHRLRERICQGYRCEQVDAMITTWKASDDGQQACVMVVIKREQVASFYAEPRRELEREFERVALAAVKAIPIQSGQPALLIDTINDNGVNGGPRAEWLHGIMLNALGKSGAETVRRPDRWSGLGLPDGVQGVLRGRVVSLPGQEALLEVSWEVDMGRSVRGVGTASFPQAIAPDMDVATYMPTLPQGTGKVALHMDTRPGGALCNGQTTELWLEASEPVFVRVINLYGKGDGALVIYSTGDQTLATNRPVSLGQFQAVKAGDVPVERFLVVASPTKAGLERFGSIDGVCRLPRTMAWDLHQGRNLPDGARDYFASTDYRLMSGEECAAFGEVPPANLSLLNELPSCW